MKNGNSRVLALTSLGISVLLILGAFMAVWLVPRGAAPASAQSNGTGEPSRITVRGSGSVSAKPDRLVMSVGVNVQESTVKAAQDKAAAVISTMVERLKGAGLSEDDFRTSQYSVETVADFDKNGAPLKITGFRVINMLEITFRNPASAPQTLDALVAAGANTIYSGGYTFSNLADLQKQAYDEAVKDAEERATRLAALSGLTLGKVISVTEASANVPSLPYERGMGAGGAAFYPGQSNIVTDVIVTYEAK